VDVRPGSLTDLGPVELAEPMPLTVAVVDGATGAALSGATIHRHPEPSPPLWAPFASTATSTVADSGGRAELLLRGRTRLTVTAVGHLPGHLVVAPDDDRSVSVTLERATTLEIQLIDETGTSLPGLTLLHRAPGSRHTTARRTDRNGRLIVDPVPQGVHQLLVDDRWLAVPVRENSARPQRLQVPAVQPRVRVHRDGVPVPGARARLLDPRAVRRPAALQGSVSISDDRGRCQLAAVIPGQYLLEVVAPGSPVLHTQLVHVTARTPRLDADLASNDTASASTAERRDFDPLVRIR